MNSGASDVMETTEMPENRLNDRTVSDVLGQITWLMSQSSEHRGYFIGDLEWLVMPAILLKQVRMLYDGDTPVACVVWAVANSEVAARLRAGQNRLKPAEWRSGDIPVIVEAISPFRDTEKLKADIQMELDRVYQAGLAAEPL